LTCKWALWGAAALALSLSCSRVAQHAAARHGNGTAQRTDLSLCRWTPRCIVCTVCVSYYTLENCAVDPVVVMAPNLPFGAPARLAEVRDKIKAYVLAELKDRLAAMGQAGSEVEGSAAQNAAEAKWMDDNKGADGVANPLKLKEPTSDYLQFLIDNAAPRFRALIPMHLLVMLFAAHTNQTGNMSWTLVHVAHNKPVYDTVRKRSSGGRKGGHLCCLVRS
jgi:hypothetical protein